jgi:hypothetical protein
MSLSRFIVLVSSFCLAALVFPTASQAQLFTEDEYNREFSFGLMMQPKGLGLDFRYGRYISSRRTEYLEAELLTIRHPKEIRIYNTSFTNTSPYTYGKQYYAYAGRFGYGNKFLLAEKKLKNTASISLNVAVGPVFLALKPVYLDLLQTDVNNNNYVVSKRVSANADINQNDVIGNSPFSKGFNELNFKMGGFAKAGFNFDWGDFTDEIMALEVGAYVDAFPQRVPIMLHTKNKYFFPSFYICVVFGNKW